MNMRFFQLMLLCSITAFCTGSEGSKSTDMPAEAEAIAQAIRLNVLHQVMPVIALTGTGRFCSGHSKTPFNADC